MALNKKGSRKIIVENNASQLGLGFGFYDNKV